MRKGLVWMMVLCSLSLMAQRRTINGYVTDRETGERLIGAAVYDTVSHQGVVTNTSGFYTLTIPKGKVALQVSYVGYQPSAVKQFSFERDTMVQFDLVGNTLLEELVVVDNHSISGPQSAQMSAIEVPISQIKAIPMIGGEVDILKAIQLLPGVQSGTEGSAGLYVRGGGPDENLILLDGVPLYNVNHLMGFFSVFNADAVKNVTLYKGNFPSQYGGRLSSIIDVRQNDGSTKGYHGNISVGVLSAKANVEGYIPHVKDSTGSTTFNVSARRTYFDLFAAPLIAAYAKRSSGTNLLPGAYFYDLNAKLTHTFANMDDKLSASFYMGDDMLYVNAGEEMKIASTTYTNSLGVRTGWGNLMAALNWEHRYNARLFSNTQLSYTRYRYMLRQSMEYAALSQGVKNEEIKEQMEYNSSMRDMMIQSNFDYTSSPKNSLHFGFSYTYHQFRPEVTNLSFRDGGAMQEGMAFVLDTTFSDGTMHGHEGAIYVEDSYSPWSWLKLNVGMRASIYGVDGKVYPSWEPRVGVRALIYKDLAFKASYAYTTQYIHMLSNSSVSLPSDLWVPVTKDIKPMHSMVVAAGLSYDILGQCEVSVEGYYKRSTNLLEYKDGATFFGSTTGWQDKVAMGDGWSYGVELLLQRKVGPVTGWIGYTWSRTMRQFDREGQEVNFGRPFHAKYDREHDLSITLQYDITKHIDIAATFVYGTGSRATLSTQLYLDPTLTDPSMFWEPIEYFEERNNYKMPDYHRLDLGINFHFPHKYSAWGQKEPTRRQEHRIWNRPAKLERHQAQMASGRWDWLQNAEHIMNISIYNVYCHANPYMMMPDMFSNKLYQVSIFPILPSISYTFKF